MSETPNEEEEGEGKVGSWSSGIVRKRVLAAGMTAQRICILGMKRVIRTIDKREYECAPRSDAQQRAAAVVMERKRSKPTAGRSE